MATSSFFTDITVDNEKQARKFLETLEAASKIKTKKVKVNYTEVTDKKEAQRMLFGK